MGFPISFEKEHHDLFKVIRETRPELKYTNLNAVLSGNSLPAMLYYVKELRKIETS